MTAFVHVVTFSLAGWVFMMNWRKPAQERDALLMVFPFLWLAGHAYMYIAKIDLFFTLDAQAVTNGLSVGNLLAVVLALVGCSAIMILSHPKKS